MDEQTFLAEQFEANRPQLRSVAYRMLGSMSEADDAVQQGWLRLSRSGAAVGGGCRLVRGATAVAGQALTFVRFSHASLPALVNCAAGVITVADGRLVAVTGLTIAGGKIVEMDILADPNRLRRLALPPLGA
jgi:hypothetical protein